MASEPQIEANRRNAQQSTGPKTAKGKAAARLNALKHGLTAQDAVVPGEDQDQFDEILQSYEDHYRPVGPPETSLVQQMVMAAWRLTRVRAMETGLFNRLLVEKEGELRRLKISTRHDQHAHVFLRDARGEGVFMLLGRYESRVERSFYRATHELERLQAARRTPPDQTNPISPSSEPQVAESPGPSITQSPNHEITKSPNHQFTQSPPLLLRRRPMVACRRPLY